MSPAHSPINARALRSAALAGASTAAHAAARKWLDAWVEAQFQPRAWAWADSGTTALTWALEASLGPRQPRTVALPGYACYDLATACDGARATAVLYDLDPATLGPDWGSLQRALAAGVSAVVAVHLFGVPVDMRRIRELASAHGAIVIEDAAQGVCATYDGRPVGSHGALSVLSFGRGKGLTAGGGGLVLANDEVFAASIGSLSPVAHAGWAALGKSIAQALLSSPGRYWLPASLPMLGLGETHYHPARNGGGLSRVGAGLLSRTVALAGEALSGRQRLAGVWQAGLSTGWHGLVPRPAGGGMPGYLRFPILLPQAAVGGGALVRRLARHGVSRGYPLPLARLPGFTRGTVPLGERLEGAEWLAEALLTLPTHVHVEQRDIDVVLEGLHSLSPRPVAG